MVLSTSSKVLTRLYLLFEVLPSSNEETNKSNIPPWQINTARDSCKQGLNYTFRQTGRSKYSLRCKTPISKSLHDLFRHPPKEPVFRMINSVTLTILFDIRGRHKLDQVIKLFDLGSSYQNFDPRTEINFFSLYRFDNLILDQKYFFEKLIS